jgi:hypothetical protein
LSLIQRDLDRVFTKRRRFRDLSTIVQDFVAAMETRDINDFNGSLLGFTNSYLVLLLKYWP